jgi:hypothetical protein
LKSAAGDSITVNTFRPQDQLEEPMPDSHRRKLEEVDGDSIKVHFSAKVKGALADLDAAVHFSEHFDGDAYAILHSWATGKNPSVREVMVALPLIAEETSRHVRESGDERAEDAWRELCNQMPENGFALTQRKRQR